MNEVNPFEKGVWIPNALDAIVDEPENVVSALCHYPLKDISADYLRRALNRKEVRDHLVERGVWLYPDSWAHVAAVTDWVPVTQKPNEEGKSDGSRLRGWKKKRKPV